MFITIVREEARARLGAAGWRYAETLNDTTEVWLKIGRRPVYLTPEADGTGCYEEEMIKAVEDLG